MNEYLYRNMVILTLKQGLGQYIGSNALIKICYNNLFIR